MKLTILIPTLSNRLFYLNRLLTQFYALQKRYLDHTEILISSDNGAKSIGQKRNELLAAARGDYVTFFDDDDLCADTYLQLIFEGIEKGVDHIGITGIYQPDNGPEKMFKCSKNYSWCERDGIYYRSAQHICPIRSGIAKQVVYPHISFGEDKAYSDVVNPLIATEHLIDIPVYFYKYRSLK